MASSRPARPGRNGRRREWESCDARRACSAVTMGNVNAFRGSTGVSRRATGHSRVCQWHGDVTTCARFNHSTEADDFRLFLLKTRTECHQKTSCTTFLFDNKHVLCIIRHLCCCATFLGYFMSDFYTGSPLDPEDLWFRDDFIDQLWELLRSEHVLLTAPRRTGKTSVMDHMAAKPRCGYSTVSVFVQDLDHPGEFLLTLLDAFHEKHPGLFHSIFDRSSKWIGDVLGRFGEIEFAGFKVALRQQNPRWKDDWKSLGDSDFFALVRKANKPLLFIVDEFPDLILNMKQNHPDLVRPFLAWFRGHFLNPHPKQDNLRWLLGGSVNLSSTLDAMGSIDLINALHDERLPVFTAEQVSEFVRRMLSDRNVDMDASVPDAVARRIGRPVPLFLQLLTQDLFRIWKREGRPLVLDDVHTAYSDLLVSSGARDKLQHYYSRITQYYDEPKRSAAYAILAKLSVSAVALDRPVLFQEFDRVALEHGRDKPEHERRRLFNQLLRDLENDFYVAEIAANQYDFASGLLKDWWRKYYA